jgi:predicted branched-subunit amino acid permease
MAAAFSCGLHDMDGQRDGIGTKRDWFSRGARASISIPGFILMATVLGFVGLARETGVTHAQSVFMTAAIWALPGQVVLVGTILSGASLPAAALAVGLSSVRLMPMVVVLMPELRTSRSPRWALYLASHFIAVTSWVIALERLPGVPKDMRLAYYLGLGSTLSFGSVIVVALAYPAMGNLPPVAGGALFMLTPIYFLTSLWGSARERASHIAMGAGLVLGPVFHVAIPQVDLLAAGTVGGGLAYACHKLRRRSAKP